MCGCVTWQIDTDNNVSLISSFFILKMSLRYKIYYVHIIFLFLLWFLCVSFLKSAKALASWTCVFKPLSSAPVCSYPARQPSPKRKSLFNMCALNLRSWEMLWLVSGGTLSEEATGRRRMAATRQKGSYVFLCFFREDNFHNSLAQA